MLSNRQRVVDRPATSNVTQATKKQPWKSHTLKPKRMSQLPLKETTVDKRTTRIQVTTSQLDAKEPQPAVKDMQKAKKKESAATTAAARIPQQGVENKNSVVPIPRKPLLLLNNKPNGARLRGEVSHVPPAAKTKPGTTKGPPDSGKPKQPPTKLPRAVARRLQSRESLPPSLAAPSSAVPPDDNEDVFNCDEYAAQIYRYLCELDQWPCYTVKPNFIDHQCKIQSGHRTTLVDWLVQVQRKFRLLPETLFLAIDVLDRYLQVEQVPKSVLQLLGVTAFFIAAKYEEIYPPRVVEFALVCADTYTTQDIVQKEREVLHVLNYNLNKPSPLQFLRRISTLGSATKQMHNLAKYILELSLLDDDLSSHRPSIKAAAAFQLSDFVINGSLRWSPLLREVTSTTARELIYTRLQLRLCLSRYHTSSKYKAITTKYSGQAGCYVALLENINHLDDTVTKPDRRHGTL